MKMPRIILKLMDYLVINLCVKSIIDRVFVRGYNCFPTQISSYPQSRKKNKKNLTSIKSTFSTTHIMLVVRILQTKRPHLPGHY